MVFPIGGGGNTRLLPLDDKSYRSFGYLMFDKQTADVVWKGPSGIELLNSLVESKGFSLT